jgi:F-type H+-transporting ATPase subunit c
MTTSIASYLIASLTIIVSAISVGFSQGLTNKAAFKAIDIQPNIKDKISNLALLSSALIETAAIVSVFIALILLFETDQVLNPFYSDLAKIGIGFAIICSSMTIGLVSSWPAQEACYTTARQPFHAQWIFNFTLIVLSIIQTPLILAFIVALFIKAQSTLSNSLEDSLRLIGAGVSIGIGCIGPALGLAHFARTAIRGIGSNRNASGRILTFTFVSQAIIESPIIFALVTSLFLLLAGTPKTPMAGIAMLMAGITTGLGMFGPGLSSGRTAASACKEIAANPENYSALARTSIFAQGVIDTAAIYVLLIALGFIIFVT